ARLLIVSMGEIEEATAFRVDDLPPKHEQGGWSQAQYQRHHDLHVQWHLKRVTKHLADLARRRRFDRLVLAGPEEATSELRGLRPSDARDPRSGPPGDGAGACAKRRRRHRARPCGPAPACGFRRRRRAPALSLAGGPRGLALGPAGIESAARRVDVDRERRV